MPSKPSREFCKNELSLLDSKWGAPKTHDDEHRLKNVLNILHEVAESEEHVRQTIQVLEQRDNFPSGYDVRQAALTKRTMEIAPSGDCPHCFHGFIVTRKPGFQDFAKRCGCWKKQEVLSAK